jgi:hypothetical protein
MVFATILILAIPKEYGYQYYGFGIYISVWILILLYQKASFYPHNIKSLPKDRLYYIFEKNRVRGKHIFKLAELHGNGFTGKKWTLVHDENIETPCFRIDKKREFQPVS